MKALLKRIREYFMALPQVKLATYRSYGTRNHLYLLGRAIDDDKLQMYEHQSLARTISNAYKQFDSHEIPDAEIVLDLPDGGILRSRTNRDGYFLFDEKLSLDLLEFADDEGWVSLHVHFAHSPKQVEITDGNDFTASLLVPPASARFGVISDIDDTILHTGVTSFLKYKVIQNSLFRHAHKRISLEGAPEFYRKLHEGTSGSQGNPIFYLSNSPWNMYQYLKLFLELNDFPKGPILLRDFKTPFDKSLRSEKPHKQKEIINILKTYPELDFVLIGDSGEHDPAIYTDIAAQFPDRIKVIYLRSVRHRKKMQRVKSIIDNFQTVPVLSVHTSRDAVIHARNAGIIR